jgi:hypothetical protein
MSFNSKAIWWRFTLRFTFAGSAPLRDGYKAKA